MRLEPADITQMAEWTVAVWWLVDKLMSRSSCGIQHCLLYTTKICTTMKVATPFYILSRTLYMIWHHYCWNHGKASSKALSPSTRRRKLPAWSYGERDSRPWMPVCTLTSVLTNTSQLAQIIPGQPGRHSTGYELRLAGQEWTCWSGGSPTNKKSVTVASGRPCNTYWSAPWWTLPALPMTWQWLTTSPSAVPGIGRARFDEHTTPGGRTRMMMTIVVNNVRLVTSLTCYPQKACHFTTPGWIIHKHFTFKMRPFSAWE